MAAVRKLTAATVCLFALAWVGQAAAAGLGPFQGNGNGNSVRTRESNDGTRTTKNISSYAGHFSYSFNVDQFGHISGSGTGAHDLATWHLEGSGPDPEDNYNCDPTVTPSGFTVDVSGFVDNGVAHLRFRLVDAVETNPDSACSAYVTAYAARTEYLAESLDKVQSAQPGGELLVSLSNPSIGNLVHSEGTVDTRKIDSNWNITITPPPPPEDIGRGNAGPGSATGPNDPRADICTITGNRRNNVLNGTPGNDIICGFGGRDRINGRGGNDIIFGGPGNDVIVGGAGLDSLYGNSGNDRLLAKDGVKDLVDGGPGRGDVARRDRKDRVRGVP